MWADVPNQNHFPKWIHTSIMASCSYRKFQGRRRHLTSPTVGNHCRVSKQFRGTLVRWQPQNKHLSFKTVRAQKIISTSHTSRIKLPSVINQGSVSLLVQHLLLRKHSTENFLLAFAEEGRLSVSLSITANVRVWVNKRSAEAGFGLHRINLDPIAFPRLGPFQIVEKLEAQEKHFEHLPGEITGTASQVPWPFDCLRGARTL